MNNKPIGIFDSGFGGLSVWREVRRALPHESLIYFADGKNCPYGEKPMDLIREYTEEAVRWLMGQGVKVVVIACNTATAAAVEYLRGKYPDMPFVGMEPAVKPAALGTKTGIVAVLATEASFKGELYRKTSAKYGNDIELMAVPGTGLVELVENGMEDSAQAREMLYRILSPVIGAGADHIVLGCTHYPFLKELIDDIVDGRDITVVDSSPAVARRVVRLIEELDIEASPSNIPHYRFHTLAGGGYLERLEAKARRIAEME